VNHPIAQLIALTCHGNAYLRGARPAQPLFPDNSTCLFCDRIVFVRPRRAWLLSSRDETVAESPDAWLAWLGQAGAEYLSLRHARHERVVPPGRLAPMIADCDDAWSIAVRWREDRHSAEQWRSQWQVWNRAAPGKRIWRVAYRAEALPAGSSEAPDAAADVGAALDALRHALERIEAFATANDCGPFAERFREALDALARPATRHGYHRDLWVEGQLPAPAASLLDAAQCASVFGGMGSWNDLAFDPPVRAEYVASSAALYAALSDAICAGANASRT